VDKGGLLRLFAPAGIQLDLDSIREDTQPLPTSRKAQPPNVAPAKSELAEPLADFLRNCMDEAKRAPDDPQTLNNLAWALATNSDPGLRDATQALQVAERAMALTQGRDPAILDTLGAAYAESGRFDKAIEWARKGMDLAKKTGQDELAKALFERIRLYASGKPHHDSAV
jgi:tetratricopeptide (TPR) repeat protein